MRDVKTRVITALWLVGGAGIVLYVGGKLLTFAALLVAVACSYEYFRFSSRGRANEAIRYTVLASLMPLGFLLRSWPGLVGGLLLASMIMFVLLIETIHTETHLPEIVLEVPAALMGLLYPGLLGAILVVLSTSPTVVPAITWLIAVVCINDIGAYFGGRSIGGEKLSPRISPNKTVSGSICGFAAGVAAALLVAYLLNIPINLGLNICFAIAAVALAQIGDLSKSVLKRGFGVKDSSSILPGHGGVLDRVDGILFAAPLLFFWPLL